VQADIILSSHLLEHVPDDALLLSALFDRLAPGGTLAVFVPIEEPDYILFHRRNYSLQSIAERVERAGFRLRRVEGSMYVNGHVWKLLTIPSRRRWPVCGPLVDAARMATLGALPPAALERLDRCLYRMGVGARQALVVAERAPEAQRPPSEPAAVRPPTSATSPGGRASAPSSSCSEGVASRRFFTTAGTPTATACAGTSEMTTALAPITA
jgi:hypothetical protein